MFQNNSFKNFFNFEYELNIENNYKYNLLLRINITNQGFNLIIAQLAKYIFIKDLLNKEKYIIPEKNYKIFIKSLEKIIKKINEEKELKEKKLYLKNYEINEGIIEKTEKNNWKLFFSIQGMAENIGEI